MLNVWIWQSIVSPHMAGLAKSLANHGVNVTYLAEQVMSDSRRTQGWSQPDLGNADLKIVNNGSEARRHARFAHANSVHICQGVRSNGLVRIAQLELAKLGRQQWILMETIDDCGWSGVVKRMIYRRLLNQRNVKFEGVLAIGERAPNWVTARGVPSSQVFPFAYFLTDSEPRLVSRSNMEGRVKLLFVGQFIALKRLELLVGALARCNRKNWELEVIGSGPLEESLSRMAKEKLPGKVKWIGQLPMAQVHQRMVQADCLVLPSRYDGWGAVVSEALMAGTPVICSNQCGASGVVHSSGVGGVFTSGDEESLLIELVKIIDGGKQGAVERRRLASWAKCLGSEAGAAYLQAILRFRQGGGAKPAPPWKENRGPLT